MNMGVHDHSLWYFRVYSWRTPNSRHRCTAPSDYAFSSSTRWPPTNDPDIGRRHTSHSLFSMLRGAYIELISVESVLFFRHVGVLLFLQFLLFCLSFQLEWVGVLVVGCWLISEHIAHETIWRLFWIHSFFSHFFIVMEFHLFLQRVYDIGVYFGLLLILLVPLSSLFLQFTLGCLFDNFPFEFLLFCLFFH